VLVMLTVVNDVRLWWYYETLAEWYWLAKETDILGEKLVPISLLSPQIPCDMAWNLNPVSSITE